jgi:hypothetical protein
MIDIPGQERIIWEVANENAIRELNDARKHQEEQECVNEFEPIGRVVIVCLP